MADIIPAILTNDEEEFVRLVKACQDAGVARVHIDVCDGEFVPTQTVLAYDILARLKTPLKFDIHLMVRQPERFVDHWWACPGVDRCMVHIESTHMFEQIAEHTRGHGNTIIATLNPDTPIEGLNILEGMYDGVQFMTVHPGQQGQLFLPDVLPKVSRFHHQYPNVPLFVDGGITPKTAPACIAAGISTLVTGSYIVKSKDITKAIQKLSKSVSDFL